MWRPPKRATLDAARLDCPPLHEKATLETLFDSYTMGTRISSLAGKSLAPAAWAIANVPIGRGQRVLSHG
jgi:hypothetical protein